MFYFYSFADKFVVIIIGVQGWPGLVSFISQSMVRVVGYFISLGRVAPLPLSQSFMNRPM